MVLLIYCMIVLELFSSVSFMDWLLDGKKIKHGEHGPYL